ncbi:MAG: phage holin family protein [Deltaproteobacteria bacterium]|nr:phage holin family protein [Deltaproteobacteria bacterium]
MKLVLRLVLVAGVFIAVSRYVPGFRVANWTTAVIAALVFGLLNATVKPVLKLVALPVTLLTLGLFGLVINAGLMALCAFLVPGFGIDGFLPALIGWFLVSVGSAVVGWVLRG